jgi:Receptor L domain
VYKGDVYITGSTDMSVFKNITTIDGSLTLSDLIEHTSMSNTTPVTDISALKNLKTITGNFTLSNVNQLKSLEALSNLETINGDVFITSSSLTSFNGLQKVKRLKNVIINSAGPELSLKGLGKDIGITQLTISNNANLKKLTDIESLGLITFFSLHNNANLISIGDMVNTTIGNQFIISGSPLLKSLGKINVSNAAAVHISDTDLEDLSCLSNISKLGQLLLIGNKNLKSLNVENLTSVTTITFHTNPYLKTLKGLENCEIGNISLQNNVRLENINDLKSIKKCYGLTITDNTNLKSIDALSMVGEDATLFGYLNITGNINLNDLCPLSKAVKRLLKTRETYPHTSLPNIANNGTNMTYNDMIKTCP